MAIVTNDCDLLFYAKKKLGVSFKGTLMLGRLTLYAEKTHIQKCIDKYGSNEKKIEDVSFNDAYSEPLFEILGAKTVDSMDYSDYEKASIIHDLNKPFPGNLRNKFSAIVDGGTIEHVFNFPVAIKSCMEAVEIGGHYIGVTPANNLMGHGFYQFSPELVYRVFSEENGFKVKKMLICVTGENGITDWYEVPDPKKVKGRIMMANSVPISISFVAEKTADKNIFETTPQQSDYVNVWSIRGSEESQGAAAKKESKAKVLYRKIMPKRLKIILKNMHNIIFVEKVKDKNLGEFDAAHFIKTEL